MMKQYLTFVFALMLLLLSGGEQTASAATERQGIALPPAPIRNDEGGPKRLVGSTNWADFGVAVVMQDPSPALLDMVNVVQGDPTQFAPVSSQILGYMTSPVVPPPLSYAVNLPTEPTATLLDVDNDGDADTGVQIFYLVVSANINGGSYLEQLDQWADLKSFLTDPVSGAITSGTLLVYAPDDQQGFPSSFGEDGLLFTADDPAVALPQGYTVVHIDPEEFIFDRSAEAELNALEAAEAASPDFSDQSISDSFNSLIDHLAERYSFTELRQLDWAAIRTEYLPQVEEAAQIYDQNPDAGIAVYATVLHRLAQSVHDAHVATAITDPTYLAAAQFANMLKEQPIGLNLGATTIELDDGRIVVRDVLPGTPAAEAGWTLGTEIVAVNDIAVADYLPTVLYNEATGTPEGQRLLQVQNLLKFPAPDGDEPAAAVTIAAILPEATAAQSFTMTPATYPLPDYLASATKPMPIQFEINPAWGYLTWNAFHAPEVYIAVMEQFLTSLQQTPSANGIILDLRGNGGGWDSLYFTMASYFFNADDPVSMHWIDQESYDLTVGDLVRTVAPEYLISAPQPELYYGGPVVILIDQNCASSCEFFTQFLQQRGRATVVAQHASKGAGAPVNNVDMPYGIDFRYTKGRAYFAGTDEMNLEAKGVTPDVRVPVTLDAVQALMQGADPVLEEGRRVLNNLVGQKVVDQLALVPLPAEATATYSAIYPENWNVNPQDSQLIFSSPDGQYALVYNVQSAEVEAATLLAPLGISDPAAALLTTREENGLSWSIYGATDANDFGYRVAIAETNGMTYSILMVSPAAVVSTLADGLLDPAIDAFVPQSDN